MSDVRTCSSEEEKYMRMALRLARRGEGLVSPNPMVGAVIVKGGEIVGRGYHQYFGGSHAEVEAIKDAGEKARGATLFVSLEPCSHFGKTPPCTDIIVKTGIRKVVIAILDPNPLTHGKGADILEKAGIDVKIGLCENEARRINETFFKYIREKMPYITVKAAASLDGKIATSTGESKWITSEKARKWGKTMREKEDAILVGVNTVIEDDPELCPLRDKERYLRIILDSKLRIPLKAKVLKNQSKYPTLIFTTTQANKRKIERLQDAGVKVEIVADKERRVDVKEVLEKLGRMEVARVLVEGGGEVIGSFFLENLVDKLFLFLSPRIIGGRKAPTWVEGKGFGSLQNALKVKITNLRHLGEDILIEGYMD